MTVGFERAISFCPLCGEWARGIVCGRCKREIEKDLPLFHDFFDKRDASARKIDRQALDAGILLWEMENIY